MSRAEESSGDENLLLADDNEGDDEVPVVSQVKKSQQQPKRRLNKAKKRDTYERSQSPIVDEEVVDDAGKEVPEDQEYDAEADPAQEDVYDNEIVQDQEEPAEAPKEQPMPGMSKRDRKNEIRMQVTAVPS